MAALRKWFGDDTSEESEDSDDADDWNVVDRQKRNKEKNKRRLKMKTLKEENTLRKASHILGMGNISMHNVEHFMDKGCNFETAKKFAAEEYMGYFLGYTEVELEDIKIMETQLSGKDDILYTAFEDIE